MIKYVENAKMIAMGSVIMSWITDLIGGSGAKIIDSISSGVKKFITTDQDKREFELEMQKIQIEFTKLEIDAESKRLEDVQNARDMYKQDNSMQKLFSIVFLTGYILLTAFMLWMIVGWVGGNKIVIPDWCVALISTIYGTISTKISTIIDFFFGSSKGSHDKDDAISKVIDSIPRN